MKQIEINRSLVGFIDLLGFSARVRQIASIEDINNLIRDVGFVQNTFEYNAKDNWIIESHKITATKVLAFSDCIITCIPFESKLVKIQGSFDTWMSEIVKWAYAQGSCVLNNIFLRGALDYGTWFHEEDILISPPLVNAYELEKKACFPIIILSQQLSKFLFEHPHRNWYSKDIEPFLNTFKKMKIKKEKYYFLDYIKVCIDSLDWQTDKKRYNDYINASSDEDKKRIMDEGYFQNCRSWLERHRKVILDARASVSDTKINKKYDWLIKYHNKYVKTCRKEFHDCIIDTN